MTTSPLTIAALSTAWTTNSNRRSFATLRMTAGESEFEVGVSPPMRKLRTATADPSLRSGSQPGRESLKWEDHRLCGSYERQPQIFRCAQDDSAVGGV